MRIFLSVTAFSLFVIVLFSGYSNYGIPEILPAAPPVEEKIDLSAMTMDQFIALGDRVFNGKGTCPLCHNAVGGRAPMLDNMTPIIPARLADARYKGSATDPQSYLMESMIDPSAFVVVGFGKAGTGDTVSPMPDVSAGSTQLSEVELAAVTAYLQDLNGMELTVEIPKEAAAADAEAEEESTRTALTTPEEVLAEFSCGACHKVGEDEGDIGPDLMKIGATRDKAFLRTAILDPNVEITKGYEADTMPDDYGEQLYAKELEILVDYLSALK